MLPEFLLERWWSYLDEVLEAIWSVMSRWRLPPLVQPPPRLPTCPSWISGRIWGGAVRATSTCLGHYWPRYSLPSPLLTHLHWQPIALMQPSSTSTTHMISNLGKGFIFPWGWETRYFVIICCMIRTLVCIYTIQNMLALYYSIEL